MKTCNRCCRELAEGEFYLRKKNGRSYLNARCKECIRALSKSVTQSRLARMSEDEMSAFRAYRKETTRRHRDRHLGRVQQQSRRHHLKRTYGLTLGEQFEMQSGQEGRCAICRNPLGQGRDRNVDHCHMTGVVRGLLCSGCNLGLGSFKDDPWRMQRAIGYLLARMSPERLEDLRLLSPHHIYELGKSFAARVQSLRNGV